MHTYIYVYTHNYNDCYGRGIVNCLLYSLMNKNNVHTFHMPYTLIISIKTSDDSIWSKNMFFLSCSSHNSIAVASVDLCTALGVCGPHSISPRQTTYIRHLLLMITKFSIHKYAALLMMEKWNLIQNSYSHYHYNIHFQFSAVHFKIQNIIVIVLCI